ncbi:MAG: 2-succinyl-5-enolpyruvyl-6-hydroxy-3-cyclohexene-1-carboxylic-acid synthase, partial [Clostridia bacterium]|nr:2-succinyl-5-enolpyruvyl-6-hydroxy-3-cyclohexene-1-carboxylic-acid synthase [Deltaproteobacteria bacterium]
MSNEPTPAHVQRIHAQRNATWAANLVAGFVANGVTDAVVSPGSRNTPVVLALDAVLGNHTHVVLDERSAGFVALGLARASGRPVVLACTSGSAAAHYYPAVVEAHYSRIPLIVVTADRPPELHHNGAGQTIEQERLFGRYASWFADLGVPSGETEPRSWAHAAAQATIKADGPVHLNVCFREPLWDPAVTYAAPSSPSLVVHRSTPGDVAIALPLSSRGVIVCGPRAGGAFPRADAEFAAAVAELSGRLGWPILADASSGVRSAITVNCYDSLLRASAFADSMRPQVVLHFGQRPASKSLATWLDAASATHILVNADAAIHDPAMVAHQLVVADPTRFCRSQAGRGAPSIWAATWVAAEKAAREALARVTSDGLWEGSIASTLGRTLPAGA